MDARSTGTLSLVARRVLQLAAAEFEERYFSGDEVAVNWDEARQIQRLLALSDIGLLLKGIGELQPPLRGQLKNIFSQLEDIIVVEDSGPFSSEERRDAYAFLISVSDLT